MDVSEFFNYPTDDQDTAPPADGAEAPFLGTCTPEEWELLRHHADVVTAGVGAVVIAAGSVDRALLILLEGTVTVEVPTGRRRRRRVAELGVGSVIGELGFLDGHPATATVVASTPVTLLRLPLERFQLLAAADAELALYVLFDVGRIVAGRLRGLSSGEGVL